MEAPLTGKKGSKVLFYVGLFVLVTGAVVAGNKITEWYNRPKVAPPASQPAAQQTT